MAFDLQARITTSRAAARLIPFVYNSTEVLAQCSRRSRSLKYELRSWYENHTCLYTDDPRVKDLAVLSPDLTIVSTYFKNRSAPLPFAWDIVGNREVLAGVSSRFSTRSSGKQTRE